MARGPLAQKIVRVPSSWLEPLGLESFLPIAQVKMGLMPGYG